MALKRLPRAGFWTLRNHDITISGQRSLVWRCMQCRNINNTTAPVVETNGVPPEPPVQPSQSPSVEPPRIPIPVQNINTLPRGHSPRYDISRAPTAPTPHPAALTSPKNYSSSLLRGLAHLALQTPHYATIHIHGKPYLVTAGDTIRLPFLMHGVMPGDILRLDRATTLGSREWTLRAGQSNLTPQPQMPELEGIEGEPTMEEPIIGRTEDLDSSMLPSRYAPHGDTTSQIRAERPKTVNRPGYINPELFLCRAVVLGTENEPLRVKEKTKRRQRHTRHIMSKHRYTMLKVTELEVRVPDIED